MIAGEFEVSSVTMLADGSSQLTLQPVGEPGFRVLELHEPEEEGTLGAVVIDINEGQKYLPRPGETVRFTLRKVRPE